MSRYHGDSRSLNAVAGTRRRAWSAYVLGVGVRFSALTMVAITGCQFSEQDPKEPEVAVSGPAQWGLEYVPPLRNYETIGGDFALIDHNGQTFQLSDYRGQAMLLFFGFTFCPDACPLAMSRVHVANNAIKREGESVLTLFVTVDPQRDKPEVLRDYIEYFGIPAFGLTGSEESLEEVYKLYNAHVDFIENDSPEGYVIDHTSHLYLIDQEGRVRYLFRVEDSPGLIAAVVHQLFATN